MTDLKSLVSLLLTGAMVSACNGSSPGETTEGSDTSGPSGSDGTTAPTSSDAGSEGVTTSTTSTGSAGSAGSTTDATEVTEGTSEAATSSTGDASSSGGTTEADTDGGLPPTTFDESLCTIFVDAVHGADGNSGKSKDQARKTVNAAVAIVAPGDTVCVYPGTYPAWKNTVNGTEDARIHFVSVERWMAKVIDATVPLRNNGNYVDIDGFEVTTTNEEIGVGIANGDGQLAEHCRIFNNHVYGIVAKTPGGSGGAGILSAGWVSNKPYQGVDVEIYNNVVHDIGNPGINAGFVQGIYVSHPQAKIHNNIVFNVSGWGIHGWHNANYVTVSNNLTSNTDGIVLGNGDSPCGQIECLFTDYFVTNNILYEDRIGIVLYDGPNHLVANNDFFNVEPSGENAMTDDPLLVDYSLDIAADFRLTASSKMIDAGSPEFAPDFDFDGKSRPKGDAPDIGPFEY